MSLFHIPTCNKGFDMEIQELAVTMDYSITRGLLNLCYNINNIFNPISH